MTPNNETSIVRERRVLPASCIIHTKGHANCHSFFVPLKLLFSRSTQTTLLNATIDYLTRVLWLMLYFCLFSCCLTTLLVVVDLDSFMFILNYRQFYIWNLPSVISLDHVLKSNTVCNSFSLHMKKKSRKVWF